MIAALVAAAVLAAGPAAPAPTPTAPAVPSAKGKKPRKGPSAYDAALLYFLAGDVPKAQDWARRGLEREKEKCLPLHRLLAEYAYLLGAEELTREQAREMVAIDRKISPTVAAKPTEKVLQRFVRGPVELAQARAKAGDVAGARGLLEQALFVDPQSADAKALLATLEPADAGR